MIQGEDIGVTKDVENTLITFNEQNTVDAGATKITYSRLNHIPFTYEISIENHKKTQKKVIVRLWLGLSTESEDIR